MNVKLSINDIEQLFEKEISMEWVYKQLKPFAQNAGLIFSEPYVGSGYLQWDLPGTKWTSFANADETQKTLVAYEYEQRKAIMRSALSGSPIERAIFTIPSDNFIYFRSNGTELEIAVTAWGCKFPDRPDGGELDAWINKSELQDVKIAFKWADDNIPNFPFKLNGMDRITYAHGWYEMDGKLPVGTSYRIEPHTGGAHVLTVIKGREEYVYDLTQYVKVNITVLKDDAPLNGCNCEVAFNGVHTVTTDQQGVATIDIPMLCDIIGCLQPIQPECIVSCMGERQQDTPGANNELLDFVFNFKTEEPVPVPPAPSPVPDPEPPVPPVPPVPEEVFILLQDYGGFPLPDLDFTLITKKKGNVQLRTDDKGVCVVPKDWFTHKEKIKVKFSISPEYQETHDLHDKKNPKK